MTRGTWRVARSSHVSVYRECGAVAKYVSIISGGLDRTADQQTQDGVTVVSETDVCEQPQIFANMATMPRHR